MIVLQILGVIFALILCVLGYYGWKIYRTVKRAQQSDLSLALAALPDTSFTLEPGLKEDWKEQEHLQFQQAELKRIGAQHVGYYNFCTDHATLQISLWNWKNKVVAAIYEGVPHTDSAEATFVYEVSGQFEGGTLCLSSNAHATLPPRPPQHRIKHSELPSSAAMADAIETTLAEGETLLPIEDAAEYFSNSYEDTCEWAWQPEQLQSEKTQQMIASLGAQIDEELMEQLLAIGQHYRVEVNIRRARHRLSQHQKLSAAQWEKLRDRLVFINEHMGVDHLIEAVYDLAGELSEQQEQVIEGFEQNTEQLSDPIGAFQMLASSLDLKAKRISTMKQPARTEVYMPL